MSGQFCPIRTRLVDIGATVYGRKCLGVVLIRERLVLTYNFPLLVLGKLVPR